MANLRNSLDSGVFRVWAQPLSARVEGDSITLTCASDFMAARVRALLLDAIREAAAPVLGVATEAIKIDVRAGGVKEGASSPKDAACASKAPASQRLVAQGEIDLPLKASAPVWRYKFEDFVTGASNNLAVAAARDMCQSGQVRSLFVTSAPGLGKTHLTQACGQMLAGRPLKVVYLTAEHFASQFVAAMRKRDLEGFKQRLCQADMLLFEDVHFLQKKKAMQEMALAVIKNLEARGGRVIFTSSFSPRQLTDMDSQLASHFCSGILASMDKPDTAMRREILKRKANIFQVNLPEAVCDILSERLSSDVRQLESCLQSMVFKARALNSGLTVEMALETAGQYACAENCMDMDGIVRLVCESFGLTEVQLRSRSRKQEYTRGRNTIFYLARKHTAMSLESIGGFLNRKHSTVTRGITQVEREMTLKSSEGQQIARAVALIERKCGVN